MNLTEEQLERWSYLAEYDGDVEKQYAVAMYYGQVGNMAECRRYLEMAVDHDKPHLLACIKLAELEESRQRAGELLEIAAGGGVSEAMERLVELGINDDVWCARIIETGSGEAKLRLARRYKYGVGGTPRSIGRAMNCLYFAMQEVEDAYEIFWAEELLDSGDKTALETIIKYADLGLADAQYSLGNYYYKNKGVEKNYEKAVEWYTKAAEQGHAEAQFSLGVYYDKSDSGMAGSIWRVSEKAIEWYTKAAEQGHVEAQYRLGDSLMLGGYKEAAEWLSKAAEQGHVKAQVKLAEFYIGYPGVEPNHKKAVELYTKAAEQGDAEAQTVLGHLYFSGEVVKQNYEKAIEWYTKSAEQGYLSRRKLEHAILRKKAEEGDAEAQFRLGIDYRLGSDVVSQDSTKAAYWFDKAAEQGHAGAQSDLGARRYMVGDYEKAVYWYTKSAEQGDPSGQHRLGYCYENGSGTTRDLQKALEWYAKAAKQGYEDARKAIERIEEEKERLKKRIARAEAGDAETQEVLGEYYYREKDYGKAAEWFEKAAEQGNANAQLNIGDAYRLGRGKKQDFKKAAYWYEKAAEQGNVDALLHIGDAYRLGRGKKQDLKKAAYWYEKLVEQNPRYKEGIERTIEQMKKSSGAEEEKSKNSLFHRIRRFFSNW